jgi:hypothetical protein
MKPHSSVRVVRMWYGVRIDLILWCFNNLDGLNCGDLLVGIVPGLLSWLMI